MPELSPLVQDQRQDWAIYHHMLPELRAGNGAVAVKTKYRMMVQHNMKLSSKYKYAVLTLYHIGYPLDGYLIKELYWKEVNGSNPDIETNMILSGEIGDIEAARLFSEMIDNVFSRLGIGGEN